VLSYSDVGSIASCFGDLANLSVIGFARNLLSASLPVTMNDLAALQTVSKMLLANDPSDQNASYRCS